MSFSWGVVSGCFIGPYIWGLYSKKTTRAGAWCGLLSGVAVFAVYYTLSLIVPSIRFDVAMCGVMAMAVSFVSVPLVSAFMKKLPENTLKAAFED
jgi:Na+(H+)/acetate symporter ActP